MYIITGFLRLMYDVCHLLSWSIYRCYLLIRPYSEMLPENIIPTDLNENENRIWFTFYFRSYSYLRNAHTIKIATTRTKDKSLCSCGRATIVSDHFLSRQMLSLQIVQLKQVLSLLVACNAKINALQVVFCLYCPLYS